jgi:hypothetical protein
MPFKAARDVVPVSPEPASFQHRMDFPRDLLDRGQCGLSDRRCHLYSTY